MSGALKKLTEDNFKAEIGKGVILVDFYADWCGPCRMMTPVLEKVAQDLDKKVTIGKLDIDHAQQIAAQYGVTSVPTLILFNGGDEIGRIVGLRDAESIKDFVLSSKPS